MGILGGSDLDKIKDLIDRVKDWIDGVKDLIPQSGYQLFTEDGIFTVPKGVTEIAVTAIGGGGGGGMRHRETDTGYGGTGGNRGAFCVNKILSVIPNQEIPITIGVGGAGGTGPGVATGGRDGSATLIGDLLTVNGGRNGYWTNSFTAGSVIYNTRMSLSSYAVTGAGGEATSSACGGDGGLLLCGNEVGHTNSGGSYAGYGYGAGGGASGTTDRTKATDGINGAALICWGSFIS